MECDLRKQELAHYWLREELQEEKKQRKKNRDYFMKELKLDKKQKIEDIKALHDLKSSQGWNLIKEDLNEDIDLMVDWLKSCDLELKEEERKCLFYVNKISNLNFIMNDLIDSCIEKKEISLDILDLDIDRNTEDNL